MISKKGWELDYCHILKLIAAAENSFELLLIENDINNFNSCYVKRWKLLVRRNRAAYDAYNYLNSYMLRAQYNMSGLTQFNNECG